jgi:hypothetical protein
MEYPNYRCDVCGKEKGEANHWFAVQAIVEMVFKAMTWEEATESPAFSSYEHICGEECLHKRLAQWLAINSKNTPESSEAA